MIRWKLFLKFLQFLSVFHSVPPVKNPPIAYILFMFKNSYITHVLWRTVVLEKTLESPLDCKEIQPVQPKGDQSWVHWKDWCWSWNSNILATWCEELTHLKRPWCWEWLRAGGEEDDRGWDGWMASPTWWTWVWVNSGSWWWTGRPGVQ